MRRTIFIFIFISCCSCSGRYVSFLDFGPIQVIGNNEEVWLFLEFDRMVYRSNAAIDTPKVISMGRIQEIVILNENGLKKRFRVSLDNGRSFHPNLSYIFRWLNNFYLYQGESALYKQSLYKWKDDHFELLPLIESKVLLNTNVFKKKRAENMTITDIESKLSELTKNSGWNHIYSNRSCGENTFKWKNLDIKIIGLIEEKTGNLKLNINALSGDDGFAISLEHNRDYKEISKNDYKKMRDQYSQKGHKK